MAWLLLLTASVLEVVMALGLKTSEGFTRPVGSMVALVAGTASLLLLAVALRSLPVGTGYAVWTGLGAAFTAVAGMVVFGESRDVVRVGAIALIVLGVVLLQATTRLHH
jgi:quaternary ammonium compound-resistance protein SugE